MQMANEGFGGAVGIGRHALDPTILLRRDPGQLLEYSCGYRLHSAVCNGKRLIHRRTIVCIYGDQMCPRLCFELRRRSDGTILNHPNQYPRLFSTANCREAKKSD